LQTCEKNKTWFSLLLNAGGTPLAAAGCRKLLCCRLFSRRFVELKAVAARCVT